MADHSAEIDPHILLRTGVLQNLDALAQIPCGTATKEARLQAAADLAPALASLGMADPLEASMRNFYLRQLVGRLWQLGKIEMQADGNHINVPAALAAIRALIEEYHQEVQTR
jgi:hypothetical protein